MTKDFEEYREIIKNYYDNKNFHNYVDEDVLEESKIIQKLKISKETQLFLEFLTQEERLMFFEMSCDIIRYHVEKDKKKFENQRQGTTRPAQQQQQQPSTFAQQQTRDFELQQKIKELMQGKTYNTLNENQQQTSEFVQPQLPSTSTQQPSQPVMHSTPLTEIEFPGRLQTVPEESAIEFPTPQSNDEINLLPPSNSTPQLHSIQIPRTNLINRTIQTIHEQPSIDVPRQLLNDQEIQFSTDGNWRTSNINLTPLTDYVKYPRVLNPLPPEAEDFDALNNLPHGVIPDISFHREQPESNDDPFVNELRELQASIQRQEKPKTKPFKILKKFQKKQICRVRKIIAVWPTFDEVNDWSAYSHYERIEHDPTLHIGERILNLQTSSNSETLENLQLDNQFEQDWTPFTFSSLRRQQINDVITEPTSQREEIVIEQEFEQNQQHQLPITINPEDDDVFVDQSQHRVVPDQGDDHVMMVGSHPGKRLTNQEIEEVLEQNDNIGNVPPAAVVATEIPQNIAVEPIENQEIDMYQNDRRWHEILRPNLPILNQYCGSEGAQRRRRRRRRQRPQTQQQPIENAATSDNEIVPSKIQRIDMNRPVDEEQNQQQQSQTETVEQPPVLPLPTFEPIIPTHPIAVENLENMGDEDCDDNADETETFYEFLLKWENSIFKNATIDSIRKYLRTTKYDIRLLDDMTFKETFEIMELLKTKECVMHDEIFPKTLNRLQAVKRFQIVLELKTQKIIEINDNNGKIIDIKLNKVNGNNDQSNDDENVSDEKEEGEIVVLESEQREEEGRGENENINGEEEQSQDNRITVEELERGEEQRFDDENDDDRLTEELERGEEQRFDDDRITVEELERGEEQRFDDENDDDRMTEEFERGEEQRFDDENDDDRITEELDRGEEQRFDDENDDDRLTEEFERGEEQRFDDDRITEEFERGEEQRFDDDRITEEFERGEEQRFADENDDDRITEEFERGEEQRFDDDRITVEELERGEEQRFDDEDDDDRTTEDFEFPTPQY